MLKLWFVCLTVFAQPPLTLPLEVKAKPGEFVVIRAKTDCKLVRWVLLDPGISVLPGELLKEQATTVVFGLRPGAYRLLAYSAKDDEPTLPAFCKVTIEADTPPPPPDPVPPSDPLAAKLQAAYTADKGDPAAKRNALPPLIGLYQAMQDHARTDATIKTVGDLLSDLQRTAKVLIAPEALIEVRKLISAEIAAALGTSPALAFDATLRARAVDTFGRIAKALEALR